MPFRGLIDNEILPISIMIDLSLRREFPMLDKLFTDHPRSVGETYVEHLESSWSFGTRMMLASLACLVHGIFPFLFTRTGSSAIRSLYNDMLTNRSRVQASTDAEIGAYI